MKTGTLILILFFILHIHALSFAQGKVEGVISDASSKEKIPNANILLYDDVTKFSPPVKGTSSDKNGNYIFSNLKTGNYLIVVKVLGFATLEKDFSITERYRHTEINFELERRELNLEEILVEAKRDSNIEISTFDLSIDMVKKLPSMSGEVDVYRALTLLPGVTTASELSNGLYVRGGSPDQTLTLVDGVVVYNPFHLGGFASSFNSDAVEEIKLIKGGFPAEYGGRISSVLDIKLREGNKSVFKGNAGIGLISSRASFEGPLTDKMTYIFSARKMYLSSLQKTFLKDENYPLYDFYDLNGKITVRASSKDWISISGYTGRDNLFSPSASSDAAYDIDWNNTFLNVSWLNVPAENKYTLYSVNYTAYEFNTSIRDLTPYSYKQDFFSTSRIEDFSLRIGGQYISLKDHTVKAGVEFIMHNFKLLNNNYYAAGLESDERFENNIIGLEFSAFVQDDWQITPLLSAQVGLRVYGFPKARYYRPEPRLSFSYALSSNFFLKGAYAMGNQFLHLIIRNDVLLPTDMWFPSTPEIKPAKSQQGVFGFEYTFGDQAYLLSVEGYYKDMDNLYEYSDTSSFTIDQDIKKQLTQGRGDAYGVEVFFNKRAGRLNGWIGYSLAYTKRYFEGVNRGISFYPRYDRRHDVSVVLSYQIDESWDAGLTWSYSTGQTYTMPTGQYFFPSLYSNNEESAEVYLDYTNLNDYRLPPYHKLDVSATYKFNWMDLPCSLTLSIYNLYNNKNSLAHYISYEKDTQGKIYIPSLKRFTLFPVMPTITLNIIF